MNIWDELSKVYNMPGIPDEAMSIIGDVMLAVSEQPEIIRCGECRRYERGCNLVEGLNIAKPDSYCSYAERRE